MFAGKEVLDQISNNSPSPLVIEDTNESVLKDLGLLALYCAMDLRNISTDLLTVHVAISCGTMCFGVVGGVNDRWDCLISGECLMQLSQCLDDAPSRHVAITQELALLLGTEVVTQAGGKLMESGNYLVDKKPSESLINKQDNDDDSIHNSLMISLTDTPDFIRLAEKFVPSPVLMSLKSASMNSVTEIREVTTIFMKWDSYSVDRFPNLIDLDPYFRCAQQILMQLGAFIRQFLVDDKGCVLISCWGTPTASYIDNAARALRAAVTMRSEFNAMGMECSFGITTGNVYCGDVGSVLRREFAVIGDTVNLSARLMSKAKHGIFIDENTYSRLSFELASLLEAVPPMQVKGKSQPINAFRFTAETLPVERESTIEESGIKQACKSVLRRHLEEIASVSTPRRQQQQQPVVSNRRSFSSTTAVAANNSSSVSQQPIKFVLIEGKIGTGKRSAARWLMQESEQLDLRVIFCRLDPKDAFVEFSLLSKLFWLMVGQDLFTQASNQRLVIMHLLREVYGDGRYTVEKFALPAMRMALGVKFLTGAGTNDTADQPRVPTRMVRETMLDIFECLLKELPSVIIIESMHYADEESLRTLLAFRELKAPALITFTSLQLDDALEYLELMNVNDSNGVNIANSKGLIESFESFYRLMKEYQHATLITLDDFNISEIDAMLRASLRNDNLPLRLAAWVHQLSGGSIFWIKEIIEYLRVTTPEEFLSIIDGSVTVQQKIGGHRRGHGSSLKIAAGYQGMSPLDVTAAAAATAAAQQQLSLSINTTTADNSSEKRQSISQSTIIDRGLLFSLFNSGGGGGSRHSGAGVSSSHTHSTSVTLTVNHQSTPGTTPPAIEDSNPPSPQQQPPQQQQPQQQKQSLPSANKLINIEVNRSKLDLFVICRFEKLSLDNQLLLKMASVVGFEFSRYVLYGILNSTQKTTMFNSLKLLVRESWITKSESKEASYLFNHPLIHTTIYQLTPFGERNVLHKIIAKYYESMNPNEPSLFSEIACHYSHADPSKAVEYALRAAEYYLRLEHLEADICISLLAQYLKHCQTVIDVNTLLAVAEHCRLALIDMDLQQEMVNSQDEEDDVYQSFNRRRSLRTGAGGGVGNNPSRTSKAPAITLAAEPVSEKSMMNKVAPSPPSPAMTARNASNTATDGGDPRKSSKLSTWFFCCGANSSVAAVVPQTIDIDYNNNKIISRQRQGDDREHSLSIQSTMSRQQSISGVSYTDRGRKILNKRLYKLMYEDADELVKRFASEGRSGIPTGWQSKILQFDYASYLQAAHDNSNMMERSALNDERSIMSRTTFKSVTVMRRR